MKPQALSWTRKQDFILVTAVNAIVAEQLAGLAEEESKKEPIPEILSGPIITPLQWETIVSAALPGRSPKVCQSHHQKLSVKDIAKSSAALSFEPWTRSEEIILVRTVNKIVTNAISNGWSQIEMPNLLVNTQTIQAEYTLLESSNANKNSDICRRWDLVAEKLKGSRVFRRRQGELRPANVLCCVRFKALAEGLDPASLEQMPDYGSETKFGLMKTSWQRLDDVALITSVNEVFLDVARLGETTHSSPSAQQMATEADKFRVGQHVYAEYNGEWHKATVVQAKSASTFEVVERHPKKKRSASWTVSLQELRNENAGVAGAAEEPTKKGVKPKQGNAPKGLSKKIIRFVILFSCADIGEVLQL